MSYNSHSPGTLNIGCLPAAVFGLVAASPAVFVTFMGECIDAKGNVGNCPDEGIQMLGILVVIAPLCALIVWATNRMARALAEQERSAAWAVLAGFLLAAALAMALYAILLPVT